MTALTDDLRRPTRWPVLDGFRGLAALIVVSYHGIRLVLEAHDLVGPDPSPLWLWPMGIGKFTIDSFFVLSGFLIVAAWDNRPQITSFVRRRARRIFPAYLLSVLVLVPLVKPDVLTSAWDVFMLVTLQGYLSDGLTASVNVPWWSLTTELHFYVLVPVLAPLLHRRFLRWTLLAAAVALSVWWWGHGIEVTELPGSLLPGRLPQFLLGALVGIAVREGRVAGLRRSLAAWPWTGRVAVAGLVALGLYLGANGTYHRRDVGFDAWIEPISGLLLAVLLLHLVVRTEDGLGSRLDHSVTRGAGLVSYSLYLWHYPILAAAVAWLDVGRAPAMAVPALTLGLAVTAVVTWASYRLVERPVMYRKRPEPEPAEPDTTSDRVPASVG